MNKKNTKKYNKRLIKNNILLFPVDNIVMIEKYKTRDINKKLRNSERVIGISKEITLESMLTKVNDEFSIICTDEHNNNKTEVFFLVINRRLKKIKNNLGKTIERILEIYVKNTNIKLMEG